MIPLLPVLPYQRLVFESPLSPEQVLRRLASAVAPRDRVWRRPERRTEAFEGTVSADGFQICRSTGYRNAFLPVIEGRVSPRGSGARIEVTLKLPAPVLLFSLVWLSIVGPAAVAEAAQLLATRSVAGVALVPLAMLLAFSLMATIGFGLEASKARKLLRDIVAAGASGGHTADARPGPGRP